MNGHQGFGALILLEIGATVPFESVKLLQSFVVSNQVIHVHEARWLATASSNVQVFIWSPESTT